MLLSLCFVRYRKSRVFGHSDCEHVISGQGGVDCVHPHGAWQNELLLEGVVGQRPRPFLFHLSLDDQLVMRRSPNSQVFLGEAMNVEDDL